MANDLVAKLGVDATDWNSGFNKAKSTVTSFAGGFSSWIAPIGAALGAAWGASESTAAFRESLDSQRKLSAVLEATGGAAGFTTSEIAEFSAEMQRLTNFEDDATTASAAVLAAFTNIRGTTFKDTIKSAMDLTTVMGGELTDNVKLLGKALNNPEEGIKKLAKAGVQLSSAQERQIALFQQSGDLLGAQGVILDSVQAKFGGAATAVADPWKQVVNVVGDVSENIGAVLLPSLNVVYESVASWLGPIQNSGDEFLDFGTTIAANLDVLLGLVETAGSMIGSTFGTATSMASDSFNSLWEVVGLGGMSLQDLRIEVMVFVSHLGAMLDIGIQNIQLFAVQTGAEIAHLFTEVAPAYITWFAENWKEILVTLSSNTLTTFENIGTNIKNVWSAILSFFRTGKFQFNWKPLSDGFINTVKALPDIPPRAVGQLEQGLKDNISSAWETVDTSMADQREELSQQFSDSKANLTERFNTESKVPSGTLVDDPETKPKKEKKDGENKFAAIGSQDAAKAILSQFGGGKIEDLTKQQIAVSKQMLTEQRETNRKIGQGDEGSDI